MGESKLKFGVKLEKIESKEQWSIGMFLSKDYGGELYFLIHLFKFTIVIGRFNQYDE